MHIKEISLQGFRNLEPLRLMPSGGVNLFYGNNAQGKTNFLESIYFCALGRSLRGKNEQQLIAFGAEESHIRLEVMRENRSDRIDVHLKREEKKGIAVNGIPVKKMGELFGTLYAVIFSPEDLSLVKGGPAERRRFLDMELCQISHVYYYDLQQYYRVLKQRNNLLKDIRQKPDLADTLFVWDEQLAERGERMIAARSAFLARLDAIAAQKQEILTGGKDCLKTEYKPNCEGGSLRERLRRSLDRDLQLGSTQVGPHKDDILFLVNDRDVKQFGSQGQQRTTALSARLAEIVLIREETGEHPVLLLDDVLSELDETRQRYLMESIDGLQAFLTCTGIEDAVKRYLHRENLFLVQNGRISRA
ncbi:MAG TPA: DNA replication/repair protein RecF [Candidatus Anaerotignum merdipullorum]|nr:DNA replication/repair protein RecF [Candidatus Anaerotignum merdipullorum]